MTPADRLDLFISEGRLIRNSWAGTDARGRETACLLAALAPEVAHDRTPSACPASVMPAWLAHLTPWIDDSGTDGRWLGFVLRYAALVKRWGSWDAATWRRLDFQCRRVALLDCREHNPTVADAVIALLDRAISGDDPTAAEWRAAREAAARSARAAEGAEAAAAAADRIIDGMLKCMEAV